VISASEQDATCLVTGYAAPQTQFVLRLPLAGYRGRYLQGGCGGMCGVIGNTIVPSCSNAHLADGGFVALTTAAISGPVSVMPPGPVTELRMQFAHKATHATAMAAKAIVTRFYGSAPTASYFVGCSGGGRGLDGGATLPRRFRRHCCGFLGLHARSDATVPVGSARADAGHEVFTPPQSPCSTRR
jgi:feruloyl esterase